VADPGEVSRFRFTAQAAAFLAVIAILAAALAASSPFAAMGLGALGVLLLPLIAVKAALRRRRGAPWRVTPAEAAVGLSSLVVAVAGAGVMLYMVAGLGLRGEVFFPVLFQPAGVPGERVGSRSVSYSDPDTHRRLKEELAKAGIPFSVRTRDGKEWISWSAEHKAVAEAIEQKVREGPLPLDRGVFFSDAEQRQRFMAWLDRKGIKHELVRHEEREHVVFDAGARGLSSVMQEYLAERSAECAKRKPKC
jgi:hypothetical protein